MGFGGRMTEQGCCGAPDSSRAARASGGPPRNGLLQQQIEQTLPYVARVARRYSGCGVETGELRAAGNLGLVEAALRFDPDRGVKFITYADWWIRKAILEALEEQSGPLRLPRYQHDRLRALRAARADLTAARGNEPGPEELSRRTGVPQNEAYRLLRHQSSAISLDQPVAHADGRPLGEVLAAPGTENPQRSLMRREMAQRLRHHLSNLNRRDRIVIRLRFGLGLERPRTLREVGRLMGVSRERVRQLELAALLKLRRRL